MKITSRQTKIRTVQLGDPLWFIIDGVAKAPRAGFKITESCPRGYRSIIAECIERGWLAPVAYMTDAEQTWETLSR